jgi:hypothetical protein
VALTKAGDRAVIRLLIGGNHPELDILDRQRSIRRLDYSPTQYAYSHRATIIEGA